MRIRSWNSTFFSLGIVLSIVGIPAMALIKISLNQNLSILSVMVQILSCLLLLNYRKIFYYPKINFAFFTILLYTLYTLFLAWSSDIPFMSPPVGFVYQLFYSIQIVFLWNNMDRVDLKQIINLLLWVSGILTLVALFFIVDNIRSTGNFFFQGLGLDEFNNFIVSRSTTATLSFITLILILVNNSWKHSKFWLYLFFMVSVFVMLCSNRRSITGTFLIIGIYHFICLQKIKIKKKYLLVVLLHSIAIVTIFVIMYFLIPSFQNLIQSSFNSLENALGTYFGNSTSFDLSANYRRQRLETIPELYLFNSNFKEFVFGRGYMTEWLDIPFLQAFYDLGFIGGIYFLIIQLFLPLFFIFKKTDEPIIKFAQYYVLLRVILHFCSGLPYGCFFPLVMLMLFFNIKKLNMNKQKNIYLQEG